MNQASANANFLSAVEAVSKPEDVEQGWAGNENVRIGANAPVAQIDAVSDLVTND